MNTNKGKTDTMMDSMNTNEEVEIIYIVRVINGDKSYGAIVGVYRSRSDAYYWMDRMQILHEHVNYQVQPYGLY